MYQCLIAFLLLHSITLCGYLSVDGHLSHFFFLANMNNAAIYVCFVYTYFQFFGCTPRHGIDEQHAKSTFNTVLHPQKPRKSV